MTHMRFRQLDRIVKLEPGVEIAAERTVSDRDFFFRDHFPQFPVLPGVLSLETMFQACDWLVRKTDEFSRSVLLLKEVRNAKFAGFVRPGQSLTVSAQIKTLDEQLGKLAARVIVDDKVVASARLVVERFNLADRFPARAASDRLLNKQKREQYEVLDPQSDQHQPVAPTSFRWMWLDRLTEFVRGHRATAIKTVSMADEPIDLYMPGYPVMPGSLIIEGLAQTGGILVNESMNFEKQLVLAKVSKATFHRAAIPGDTMSYSTEIAGRHARRSHGAWIKPYRRRTSCRRRTGLRKRETPAWWRRA